jgi:hypothetical protein
VIAIKIIKVNLKGSSFCVAFKENAEFASNPASLLIKFNI